MSIVTDNRLAPVGQRPKCITTDILRLFLLIFYSGVTGADKMEVQLYRHLMHSDRYESSIRPTPDHRLATNVTFGFLLHQVINVDEKNQQLTTSSWMNVNWMDQRLRWNSSEWDGLKLLHIPNQKIWKPDIILTNNADHEYAESAISTDVFVTDNGNITWLYFAIYQSSCQIRVRFYPFDDQECKMTFASWSHSAMHVNLLLLTEEGDLSNYVNSSEWALLDMKAHRHILKFSANNDSWPVITITIHLSRRPLFYVFNHILPCVLISIMSMLGFYIPAETGEKVTMCITTMLSMGVFLKTITESMPPTSEAVPLIGMYYGVSLFIVCAATVVNVITLNVHNRGYKNSLDPVPSWARRYILGYLASLLCITVYPSDFQMVHLAEKRRRTANDEEFLAEFASGNCDYAQALSKPVVLKTETDLKSGKNTTVSVNCRCTPAGDKWRLGGGGVGVGVGVGVGGVKPAGNADHWPNGHAATGSMGARLTRSETYSEEPMTFPEKQRVAQAPSGGKVNRAESIYDHNYELKALRRLNSQASLLSGALTLMHVPLSDSRSLVRQSLVADVAVFRPRCTTSITSEKSVASASAGSAAGRRTTDRLANWRGRSLTGTNDPVATSPPFRCSEDQPSPSDTCDLGDAVAQLLRQQFEEKFSRVLKKIYQTLEHNDLRSSLAEERSRIMWEWRQLAIIIDRLLLLCFVIATGLTTFLILLEPIIFSDDLSRDGDPPPII